MSSEILMKAKLSESTERYEDMAKYMKEYVQGLSDTPLQAEERNLLSVAYKNVVGTRRSAWRVVQSGNPKNADIGQEVRDNYRDIIVKELKNICDEVIELLDTHLIKKDSESESYIFFMKMKADYYRYLCEVCDPTSDDEEKKKEKEEKVENSSNAYNAAFEKAEETLPPTHPIRLGLALNYSVFHYEIENKPDKACTLAKKAFDDAISELDKLQEDSYKDSTLIMQLLRDNLTLWTSEDQNEEENS